MESTRSIVFFIDSISGGGAERICTLLANSFSLRAYKVTVVTIKAALSTDYFLSPEVHRVSLAAERKSSSLLHAIKNNAALLLKLRKILKNEQPDCVISFMPRGNVVCSLACINITTTHIASERNYPPLQNDGAIWHFLRKYIYQLPTVVVSQTKKTSNWLEENTNCRNTTVIPNPVTFPLQTTAPKGLSSSTVVVNSGRKLILGVGRLVNQKQFDSLIATFSTVAEDNPKWDLIIVGEGPNREKLQQQVDSLMLQHRIQLVGKQANMEYWYKQAEIFVLTSKFEGYPNALLEAMSYGVAPISYNCDTGPDSIIKHKYTGLLVPLDDKRALASSICTLMKQEDLREKIGKNATEVIDTHSIDFITTQWESLFPSGAILRS